MSGTLGTAEARMMDREIEMLGRFWTAALLISLLGQGCAPGRVASGPPAASDAARPASTPAPSPSVSPSPSPTPERIDFAKQILSMLEEKCSPCHFPGGRMYERLPFDRQETIQTLGKATLTRLRDPVDQELMRTFLEQRREEPGAHPAP